MAKIPKPNIRAPQMETFHTHHATSAMWYALPSPVTTIYSLLIGGSVTGIAYYFGDMAGDGKGMMWMYIAMAAMTVVGLILMFFRGRKMKKQAANREQFEEAVKGSASGWDAGGGGNDLHPAQRDGHRRGQRGRIRCARRKQGERR